MRLAPSAFALALCLVGLTPGAAQDVPMFRFGPSHQGLASGRAIVFGAHAWRFPTGGKVRSTPAVAEGKAFFGSEDGNLYAVSLKEGKEVWRFKAGADISCSPAVARGLVVFLSRDGVLHALHLQDGREAWRLTTGPDAPPRKGDYLGWDYWLSSPTVEGDTAYVGGGDGRVYAVSLADGKVLWSFPTAQRVRSCPAVKDGVVFVGSFDGHVYALDARTGQEKWRFDTRGGIQSSPAVVDGTVYIGSRSAAVFALDARTGTLKWCTPHPNGSWVLGSPAVAGGKVIVGSSDEQFLQALDAQTGRELWRLDTRHRVLGSPVVAGDVVLCPSEGAYCMAVDLETGLVLGMEGAEGPVHTSPVPTEGLILLGSDDSSMHAFRAASAPARTPAEQSRVQACAGTFEDRPGSALTLSPTGNGFLQLKPGGFPPALVTLGTDGILRCPAYDLELKASFAEGGGPAQLSLGAAGKEKLLKRLH